MSACRSAASITGVGAPGAADAQHERQHVGQRRRAAGVLSAVSPRVEAGSVGGSVADMVEACMRVMEYTTGPCAPARSRLAVPAQVTLARYATTASSTR